MCCVFLSNIYFSHHLRELPLREPEFEPLRELLLLIPPDAPTLEEELR